MQHNPYSIYQHAFRRGRSCDSALTEVTQRIEKALSQGEKFLGVFLDIEGAFDNVTYEALFLHTKAEGAYKGHK